MAFFDEWINPVGFTENAYAATTPGSGGMFGLFGSGGGGFPGMSGGMPGMGGDSGGMFGLDMFGGEGGGMFSGTMSGGGLIGGLGGSEAIYGKKPAHVRAPTPSELVSEAAKANLGASGDVLELANRINTGNQDQLIKSFERAVPGSTDSWKQQLENITAGLRGELNQADQDAIARAAAARGIDQGTSVSGGFSGFDNARYLRDIGKRVYDVQQEQGRALNDFTANMARFRMPQLYDVSQNFLRPSYDPYAQFQNALYQAKVDAAPIPAAAGAAAAQQALVESVLAAYSGSPKSGMASYQNPFTPTGVSTTPYTGGVTGGWGYGGGTGINDFGDYAGSGSPWGGYV